MHNHQAYYSNTLRPVQQWRTVDKDIREISPGPSGFIKKDVGARVYSCDQLSSHAAIQNMGVQPRYERPDLVDNKENRCVGYQPYKPWDMHESPKRISKTKSVLSQNTNSYLSPISRFDADDNRFQVRGDSSRNCSPLTVASGRSQHTSNKKVFFKFKVYATKVEKWQIDECGNEIPGGLLETVHGQTTGKHHSERIQPRQVVLPPPFKLLSSKYIHLPLPRESQELLVQNIKQYNTILERQNQLQSIPHKSPDVLKQLETTEQQRRAIFKDQVEIIKNYVPADQFYSQLVQSEMMANDLHTDHSARIGDAESHYNSGSNASVVNPATFGQNLDVPFKAHQLSGNYGHFWGSPKAFESLIDQINEQGGQFSHPEQIEIAQDSNFGQICSKNIESKINHQEDGALDTYQTPLKVEETNTAEKPITTLVHVNDSSEKIQLKRGQSNQQEFEFNMPFQSSELYHQPQFIDEQDRGLAVESKDFNDWIEKGLFREIDNHNLEMTEKTKPTAVKQLSLITEVPEDRSESSPHKGDVSSNKKKNGVGYSNLQEDNPSGLGCSSKLATRSKPISAKQSGYHSSSNYPHENQDDMRSLKYNSQDFLSTYKLNAFNANEGKAASSIPVLTTVKFGSEENHEPKNPNWLSPVKVLGSILVGRSNSNSKRKQKSRLDGYIKEALSEEEEEMVQNKKLKEISPHQSIEFKAHKINTDCSASVSNQEMSHENGTNNLNVVFPSLRFSSAKLDRSIQVRTSLNVIEGNAMKVECNNFVFLDPNAAEDNNINAYVIEAFHIDGTKKEKKMRSEEVQTDKISPFIATQVVQELLKSQDFANEIRGSASNQPFTITVEQDKESNDFVINVDMSHDFEQVQVQPTTQELRGVKHQEERGTGSESEHNYKLGSRPESIREMSELGHTNHLLNFDFTKKEIMESGQKGMVDGGIHYGTIAEKDEQENSQEREFSLEDDQVTIDNPILKEYDATASPDHHARTSRLEDVYQDDGFQSATSGLMPTQHGLDYAYYPQEYLENPSQMIDHQQNKFSRAMLYQIAEQSNEESEQLRMSKQQNMPSAELKDNQSEVFNSKAYERLFGEAIQVSDSKFDRSKKGLKSMTAYQSKETLNIIMEENPTINEPTNSFIEFLNKKDSGSISKKDNHNDVETPRKKAIEIEDIIESKSKSKVKESQTNQASGKQSNQKLEMPENSPIEDMFKIQPHFIEAWKEHIYAIRHCDKKMKKSKSSRSVKSPKSQNKERSLTPNKKVQAKSKVSNTSNNASYLTEHEEVAESNVREISHKEQASKRTIEQTITDKKNSKDLPALGQSGRAKTPTRRSPTPTISKGGNTNTLARSVNQIKKGLDETSHIKQEQSGCHFIAHDSKNAEKNYNTRQITKQFNCRQAKIFEERVISICSR